MARVLPDAVTVLMVSYLEDYLKSLVAQAAMRHPQLVHELVREHGSDEERKVLRKGGPPPVIRWAKRRVSFKEGAKNLIRIYDALFGCLPWRNDDEGRLLRDLVRVRNIVVHSGSVPEQIDFEAMETTGIVVPSNKFFYKLDLLPFLLPLLGAAGMVGVHLNSTLEKDPRYCDG